MTSANTSKIIADPLVTTEKNFGFGELPIIVIVVVNEIVHRNIPDKNIVTTTNLENRSGKLKSLNIIIVPTEVHHKYVHGEVTTIEKPVKYFLIKETEFACLKFFTDRISGLMTVLFSIGSSNSVEIPK